MPEQINPYEILAISPSASTEELKDSYKKLVKNLHPDLNPGVDNSMMYQNVIEAYDMVGTPDKRANYNMLHPELFKNEKIKSSDRLNAIKMSSAGSLSAVSIEDIQKVSLDSNQNNTHKWMQLKTEIGTILKEPEKEKIDKNPFKYLIKRIKEFFIKKEKKQIYENRNFEEEIIPFGGQPEKQRLFYFTVTPFEAEKGTYRELAIKFNEIEKKLRIKIPAKIKDKTILRIKNPYSFDKIEIQINVSE